MLEDDEDRAMIISALVPGTFHQRWIYLGFSAWISFCFTVGPKHMANRIRCTMPHRVLRKICFLAVLARGRSCAPPFREASIMGIDQAMSGVPPVPLSWFVAADATVQGGSDPKTKIEALEMLASSCLPSHELQEKSVVYDVDVPF